MDLINLLSSLNKISLIAFFITSIFIGYQIYFIRKELLKRREKLTIPDFNEKVAIKKLQENIVLKQEKQISVAQQKNSLFITPLIIFLIVFLLIFTFSGIANLIIQKKTTVAPVIQDVDFVASKGIRVYNEKWMELDGEQLENLNAGEKLIVGVETVPNSDIDMARIKINEDRWQNEHITSNFNKSRNVFFRGHTVSSQAAVLKIEAQLHSKTDGWLSE